MAGKRGTDLPEPAWWKRARQLASGSHNCKEIGRILGKSDNGVRHALNPERNRERLRQQRAEGKYKDTRYRFERDTVRMHARAEARIRWRNEHYSRPLEAYYRELECL